MWTATLNYKQERTDGGIDFNVTFTDGTRKFQKTLTFFGNLDLGLAVKQQIASIEALYQTADAIQVGPIDIPADKPPVTNQALIDVQTLKKLQVASTLGLVASSDVTAQANIVKQNPDFLTLI